MTEQRATVAQGGVDPQTTLLHNIRQLSGVMEAAQNAGHDQFVDGVSTLRSDLMNIAGMSSGYDSRNSDEVKQDFFVNGQNRIESLVSQANNLQGEGGLGSALASRIAGVGAGLISNGYIKAPELERDIDLGKSTAQQQVRSGVVGALAGVLKGAAEHTQAPQSSTRWQDLASKASKGPSGPGL